MLRGEFSLCLVTGIATTTHCKSPKPFRFFLQAFPVCVFWDVPSRVSQYGTGSECGSVCILSLAIISWLPRNQEKKMFTHTLTNLSSVCREKKICWKNGPFCPDMVCRFCVTIRTRQCGQLYLFNGTRGWASRWQLWQFFHAWGGSVSHLARHWHGSVTSLWHCFPCCCEVAFLHKHPDLLKHARMNAVFSTVSWAMFKLQEIRWKRSFAFLLTWLGCGCNLNNAQSLWRAMRAEPAAAGSHATPGLSPCRGQTAQPTDTNFRVQTGKDCWTFVEILCVCGGGGTLKISDFWAIFCPLSNIGEGCEIGSGCFSALPQTSRIGTTKHWGYRLAAAAPWQHPPTPQPPAGAVIKWLNVTWRNKVFVSFH